MTEITLEALGLNENTLAEKLVDKIALNLMTSLHYDDADGEWRGSSPFAKKLDNLIKSRLDKIVNDMADKHVLPKVNELVEGLVLQETNKWGEKTGNPVTFIEYLTQRADAYMTEPLNYQGKTKAEDSFSWSKSTTRIAFMIDKHLHYSIDTAMKAAFASANSSIASGLRDATLIAINDVAAKLKVDVKTK
jgi:hypothetical protein